MPTDLSLALRCRLRAGSLEQAGQLPEAEAAYREALAADPADHAVHHALGLLAFRRGDQAAALRWIDDAARLDERVAVYCRDLCEINRRLGRHDAALAAGQRACRLAPSDAQAHFNLALAHAGAGAIAPAIAAYRQALALDPHHGAAWNNLGLALEADGQTGEAIAAFARALAIDPRHANAAHHHARLCGAPRAGDDPLAEALNCHRQGLAHYQAGHIEDAEAAFRQALARHPEFPEALNSLGFALQDQGRMAAAIACFEQALQLAPEFAVARVNLGMIQLKLGDWQPGWDNYEARWTGSAEAFTGKIAPPACPLPRWNGEPVSAAARLLVICEQGFGDMFQFARYLPRCAERFAAVRFIAPESLQRLLRSSFGTAISVDHRLPTDFSAWDYHCPLLSLPRAFATRPQSIPAQLPYLRVAAGAAAPWRARLEQAAPGLLRVGVAWAGRREHQFDDRRSLRFAQLEALFGDARIAWVSLQKWTPGEGRPTPPAAPTWLDWTDELDDFADTAALIDALDLVISIDSAVAHLAGGLDVPVWLLNRFDGEWRWFCQRDDSPWYPRLRIFNQPRFGDWASVLDALRVALARRAGQPPRRAPASPVLPAPVATPTPRLVAVSGLPGAGAEQLTRYLAGHPDIERDEPQSPLAALLRAIGDTIDTLDTPPAQRSGTVRGMLRGWCGERSGALLLNESPDWLPLAARLLAADPECRLLVGVRALSELAAPATAETADLGAALAALRALLDLPEASRCRIYFIRHEDLNAHPAACLAHLLRWLGLPPCRLDPADLAPDPAATRELSEADQQAIAGARHWFDPTFYSRRDEDSSPPPDRTPGGQ